MHTYTISYSAKDIASPFKWQFFLTHYVFMPTIRQGNSLIRLYRLPSKKLALVTLTVSGVPEHPKATAGVKSRPKLTPTELQWLKTLISWRYDFPTDVSEFYDQICHKDPVLKAASQGLYGAKLSTDPDVFESVIGVVVAQNVQFSRIYKMTELLCQNFGDKFTVDGKTYYTFPTPEKLAQAPLDKIRACKVGYRDKYIKGIAQYVIKHNLNLNRLRQIKDTEQIRQELMKLPGVGPYTADLAIAIGFRRPTFHLDLFSREAMYTFYFKGKKVSDDKILNFVNKSWGKWKHHAMLLLTTNTDEWAKNLGLSFRLKSGARSTDKV